VNTPSNNAVFRLSDTTSSVFDLIAIPTKVRRKEWVSKLKARFA